MWGKYCNYHCHLKEEETTAAQDIAGRKQASWTYRQRGRKVTGEGPQEDTGNGSLGI